MSPSTTPTIDSVAFSASSFISDNDKHNGKQFLSMSIAKDSSIQRNNIESYMVVPQEVRNALPTTNRTKSWHM